MAPFDRRPTYTTFYWFHSTPLSGKGSRRHIAVPFGTEKTRMVSIATRWCKTFHDMFSRFDRIPACDGRTDGRTNKQTDGHLATAKSALCIASRRKNFISAYHIYIYIILIFIFIFISIILP